MCQLLALARLGTRTAERGEQAAAQVFDKKIANEYRSSILPYENSDVRKQNFVVRLPVDFGESYRALHCIFV